MDRLKLGQGDTQAGEIERCLEQALGLGHPRACFRLLEVDGMGDDYVVIGGEKFYSRVLRINLEKRHDPRVAVFVVTCGVELERWAEAQEDFFLRFCAEEISELAMGQAFQAMEKKIRETLGDRDKQDKKFSIMEPGSLEDWPLTEQRPLFKVAGDVFGVIGVELTPSMLMRPRKSTSGIRYSSPEGFTSCRLCSRPGCPGRSEPYDRHLYESTYVAGGGPLRDSS
ncbi:MAG: vitamin B12 dependent methionine synthase [Gemmatimonadota bacterium]|nr:vitamin B12 dependent methionine synthase [Gemmatimonadota bacterium]